MQELFLERIEEFRELRKGCGRTELLGGAGAGLSPGSSGTCE